MIASDAQISVKPLIWQTERKYGMSLQKGRGLGLTYEVSIKAYSPGWIATFDGLSVVYDGDCEEDAKAAAQADYERRILSTLEPQHAPVAVVPAGWVCVPKELNQWMRTQIDEGIQEGSIRRLWERALNAAPPAPLMTEAQVRDRLLTEIMHRIIPGGSVCDPQAICDSIRELLSSPDADGHVLAQARAQAGAKALREMAGKIEARASVGSLNLDCVFGMRQSAYMCRAEADRLEGDPT